MVPSRIPGLVGALLGAALLLPASAAAQRTSAPLEARVWLDRGSEPTFRRGDGARLYYRASRDAFVAIFQIDTNGSVRMIFPRSPDETNLVRGGLDYRLLFARSSFWQVDEDPGVGYFFLVASPEPFDLSAFRYSRFDRGWDVSRVAREVYRDPYVAMDDYVAALIPDWQELPYALDFVTYHVGGRFEYPRFLCYDCHGFRPYSAWNPYAYDCANFRMLIYNDPFYYPATRYRGDRVVYVRPPRPFEPRFDFKERTAGEAAAPLLLDAQRRSTAGIGSGGSAAGGRAPAGGANLGERRGGGVGTAGGSATVAPPPAVGGRAGGTDVPSGRPSAPITDGRPRPALQPRPSADPGRPPPPAPSAGTSRPGPPPSTSPPPATRPDPRPQPSPSGGGSPPPERRPQPTTPAGGSPPPVAVPTRPPPAG